MEFKELEVHFKGIQSLLGNFDGQPYKMAMFLTRKQFYEVLSALNREGGGFVSPMATGINHYEVTFNDSGAQIVFIIIEGREAIIDKTLAEIKNFNLKLTLAETYGLPNKPQEQPQFNEIKVIPQNVKEQTKRPGFMDRVKELMGRRSLVADCCGGFNWSNAVTEDGSKGAYYCADCHALCNVIEAPKNMSNPVLIKRVDWHLPNEEKKPYIVCPTCGGALLGPNSPHTIHADGSVTKSVVCRGNIKVYNNFGSMASTTQDHVQQPCTFHAYVKLEGWTGGTVQ